MIYFILEAVTVLKTLTSKSQTINIFNINNVCAIDDLLTNHYQVGVVLDANCNRAAEFLSQVG